MAALELSAEELAIIEKRRDRIKAQQRKVSKLRQLRDSLYATTTALSNYGDDNDKETLTEAKRVLALTNPKKRAKRVKKAAEALPVVVEGSGEPLYQEETESVGA